jgi:hypothetical protein
LHKGDKRLRQLRIKLRAAAALDFRQGVLLGAGVPVGAVVRHHVKRIHNRQDARRQRDLLALQAVGVTRAVPAFVMVEDVLRDGVHPVGHPCDFCADFGMRFDNHPFFLVERARLAQDG